MMILRTNGTGYRFFIGDMELPYAPSEFKIKVASKNDTVELINGNDINILKTPKLQEISFEVTLPRVQYPFARKLVDPAEYIKYFQNLILYKTPVRLLIIREMISSNGQSATYQETDIKKVSLEDFEWGESVENGRDITVSLHFKEYIEYGTDKKVTQPQQNAKVESPAKPTEEVAPNPTEEPKKKEHTVQKGDSLWKISKKYYGNGDKWQSIYNANKQVIENTAKKNGKKSSYKGSTPGWWIYPGTKLIIP